MKLRPRDAASRLLLVLAVTTAEPADALAAWQRADDAPCDLCHNELEFLRQHAETLQAARALFVPSAVVRASAHGSRECTECHEGFDRYPHRADTATSTCAGCHEVEEEAWSRGVHATEAGADCTTCHGVHDVPGAEALAAPGGILKIRQRCASCHQEARAAPQDPHAYSVACSGCHAAHGTRSPEDPASRVHFLAQAETCGVCHDSIAALWSEDAHGAVVLALGKPGGSSILAGRRPPTCTSCHGSHDMHEASDAAFSGEMVLRCAACHERYARSFSDTYHGQASALGLARAATCPDCHTAHRIRKPDDPASTVNRANLATTCGRPTGPSPPPTSAGGSPVFTRRVDRDCAGRRPARAATTPGFGFPPESAGTESVNGG